MLVSVLQVTSEGDLWELYSDLSTVVENKGAKPTLRVDYRVCQHLQKALACHSQKSGWEKDSKRTRKIIEVGIKYIHGRLFRGPDPTQFVTTRFLFAACLDFWRTDPKQARQLMSSARMSLRGVVAKVRQGQTAVTTGEIAKELQEVFRTLGTCMEELNAALESVN